MNMLFRLLCKHHPKNLAIHTITYNSEYVTCTAEDHEIVCMICGKVILAQNQYDAVKDLLVNASGRDER